MVETRAKIEHGKAENKALKKKKEELKAALKGVVTADKTKIQTEIDEITEQIRTNDKEIKRTSEEREVVVAEETTARTEMT